jgi:hypothetical protein
MPLSTSGPRGPSMSSIGYVGDGNIRSSTTLRMDVYGFSTLQEARNFGVREAQAVITGVPDDWECPQ